MPYAAEKSTKHTSEELARAAEHASLLEEWRADKGLKWSEVARQMGSLFGVKRSDDYLRKIASGVAPLARAELEVREALRNILGIRREEWQKTTGLYVPPPAVDTIPGRPLPSARVVAMAALPQIEGRLVPVESMAAANPKGVYSEDFETVDLQFVEEKDDFGSALKLVRVCGDSMTGGLADIHDGELLYIDSSQHVPLNNKIFLVYVHGDGYMVKRVRKIGSELWLMSDNPEYEPLRPSQVSIIGQVDSAQPPKRKVL